MNGDGGEATAKSPDAHGDAITHAPWPGRRVLAAWFGAAAAYAGVVIVTGHADGTWGTWACGAYAVTALLFLVTKRSVIPLAAALGGALVAPLLWLITEAAPTGEVVVIGRSAAYLLKHSTPYLPASQLIDWQHYNPYLPLMEVFGLPRSSGLTGVIGDPRIWTTMFTVAVLAGAFVVASPHRIRDCPDCRHRTWKLTALATASPLIAFPLAVGVTDPPLIALLCLGLAWASRGKMVRVAAVLAVACAMKTTAWPAVPVLAIMAWVQYAPRIAARFSVTTAGLAGILAAIAAPDALATPVAVDAVKQNLIAYPLGTTRHKTPAASPLPGHLIAGLGPVGHTIAVTLMVIALVAFAAWLLLRPPRDAREAAFRLAVGYAVMFTLDPSTRFGYFTYPLALLGWLVLTRSATAVESRK